MKKIAILCIALLLCSTVFAGEPDFRNVSWGMSYEEVLKAEKLTPISKEDTVIGYKTSINSYDCNLIYDFAEDKLYAGMYFFLRAHTNYNNYISDYKSLKKLLEKKYGVSAENDKMITNEAANVLEPGAALAMGYLAYISKWDTDTTDITLALMGGNFEFKLVILYQSKEYAPLVEQANEEKTMDSL